MTSARHRTCRRAVLVTVLFTIGLVSCADGTTTTLTNAAPVDRVVVLSDARPTVPPPATRPPEPPAFVPAVSRPDLVGEVRTLPAEVVPDPTDGRVLHVRYLGGPPACHGARVAVVEGPATVRVLLFTGALPEAAGTACPTVAVAHQIDVRLDLPLGTRDVLSV